MNWSGFGLFISFFLISGNLFYSYRRKKKDNKLLADQNQKISQQKEEIFTQNEILLQQKEEITTQRDELDSSRNILRQQKQKLENVHNELTTSIHYAKSIQNATLPSNSSLKKILSEYFIFFKPQSIVGGDFYWSVHAHGKIYVAAADCTGHGVPGGFMSMLGMSFLNEIVNRESISEVDLILNRLRELVIESLHQKQTLGSLKDGMSVGICAIDNLKGTLEFAGANTPVYLLRQKGGNEPIPDNSLENHSYILEEVRPDFMPVSIHPKIRSFSKKVFTLQSIEALFMSSDGYTDQFGGEHYKKFGKRAFKELLLNNAGKPMKEQYSIVSETFETWKGENNQIDDVMVIGIDLNSVSST